jgi:hypothetical protein
MDGMDAHASELMSVGCFAEATLLSRKALCLYDEQASILGRSTRTMTAQSRYAYRLRGNFIQAVT